MDLRFVQEMYTYVQVLVRVILDVFSGMFIKRWFIRRHLMLNETPKFPQRRLGARCQETTRKRNAVLLTRAIPALDAPCT